jgi:hypothetical protein
MADRTRSRDKDLALRALAQRDPKLPHAGLPFDHASDGHAGDLEDSFIRPVVADR